MLTPNRTRGQYDTISDVARFIVLCLVISFPLEVKASPTNPGISLKIIRQIESSNNPHAIGDDGKSLGLYQLFQDVVTEYNAYHNTRYLHKDALSATIGEKMASWYLNVRIPQMLRHFKQPVTIKTVIWAYNAGIGNVVKGRLPQVTKDYFVKYERLSGVKL